MEEKTNYTKINKKNCGTVTIPFFFLSLSQFEIDVNLFIRSMENTVFTQKKLDEKKHICIIAVTNDEKE